MSAPARGERGSDSSDPGRGGMGGNDGAVIERGSEAIQVGLVAPTKHTVN
jgi:hypothetical protein